METGYFLPLFRALHERVRGGQASEAERARYAELQGQFADCLVTAQNLAVPSGLQPRRDFRVSHAFPLEVGRLDRTVTHDISQSGFSALVPCRFREGQEVAFSLLADRGAPPISGVARVVAIEHDATSVTSRVCFAFLSLARDTGHRLESALFEAALSRLA